MSTYKQNRRHMKLATPLGENTLLITGFEGTEEISTLYSYRLELLAKKGAKIDFDKLLGHSFLVAIRILDEKATADSAPKFRYFSGICRQFSQGNTDDEFTSYQAEIVPEFWLTTRIARSRIFQQISVPDILKKVLKSFKVDYIFDGKFEKRDYCVQYRETDFNFACRLMEEEGIFYYFRHGKDGHEMVVSNTARTHTDVPGSAKVRWDNADSSGSKRHHIHQWIKRQEIRSGKFTVWDHSFAFPGDNLEATKSTLAEIPVGKTKHKLEVANNKELEIYDYPGEYAKWFDGVDNTGAEQPGELKKIFQENARTAELRMQAETCAGLRIHGTSNCPHFTPGHKFHLAHHPDAEGDYILTSVHHSANAGNAFRTGDDSEFHYTNTFTCIPKALPFRPQRITPKPCIIGVQTATVTGPAGQEIFVDKHARVKVQFPWDREGKHDADSSCWIRVSQAWGGGGYGGVSIPRIGHEVIVEFMEGDPDRPIITGRVYNAKNMPNASNAGRKTPGPKDMKEAAMMTSFKSQSTPGGGGSNEITMNDKKGAEGLFFKAQKDEIHNVGNDREDTVGNNETRKVAVDRTREVGNNESVKVGVNRTVDVGTDHKETIGANQTIDIGANQTISIGANQTTSVGANSTVTVTGMEKYTVNGARMHSVMVSENILNGVTRSIQTGLAHMEVVGLVNCVMTGIARVSIIGASDYTNVRGSKTADIGGDYGVAASGKIVISAPDITLVSPGGFIRIDGSGVTIKGTKVKVNSGGSPGSLSGAGAGGSGSGGGGSATGPAGPSAPGGIGGAAGGLISPETAEMLKKVAAVIDKIPGVELPSSLNNIIDGLASGQLPDMSQALDMIPLELLPPAAQQALGVIKEANKQYNKANTPTAPGGINPGGINPGGIKNIVDPNATPTATPPAVDSEAAADYATKNAGTSSNGECARAVREAIESTGITLERPASNSAKDYGPSLEKAGYEAYPTTEETYTPQKGDVVVIQPYPGQPGSHGHIQIHNGTEFVSDFKQKDPLWPSNSPTSGYQIHKPPFTVYRPKK